jgi:hypothetical protein
MSGSDRTYTVTTTSGGSSGNDIGLSGSGGNVTTSADNIKK